MNDLSTIERREVYLHMLRPNDLKALKNKSRNGKCFCGSNKKYKKCCMNIVDDIYIKRNGKFFRF